MKSVKLLFLLMLAHVSFVQPITYITLQPIVSADLSAERDLLKDSRQAFYDQYPSFIAQGRSSQAMVATDLLDFELDEHEYQMQASDVFFINAILDGEVIGYISFDLEANRKVNIRNFIIATDFDQEFLLKELLFALFQEVPNVKSLSCQLRSPTDEILMVFQELGFVCVDSDQLPFIYELEVSNKCKICEVLYGADFWDDGSPEAGDFDTEIKQ